MKKILILFIPILLLMSGCGNTDTPTKKVEEFLGKYQTMDTDVLSQLDSVIDKDNTMKDDNKDEYKSLMEKQYQNLSYKIKNETTNGNSSTVEVEVEVFDYANALDKAEQYYIDHKEEFMKDDKTTLDDDKFMEYKIKQMKNVTDKVKYTIEFELTKENGKWELSDISDTDREKLHGLYEG